MDFDRVDSGELRFLAECMKDCQCCGVCSMVPCAGVTAGGFCDEMCLCDEGRGSDDEYEGSDV